MVRNALFANGEYTQCVIGIVPDETTVPLENRVTPMGEIVAVSARGTMMGNRGVLHNDRREIVRPWQVRRWITCMLEFRGRHREVMQPNRWTELFFLDEVTAFSAGHRPCAECRNADYKRFRALWETVHGTNTGGADAIDKMLHEHRIQDRRKRTYSSRIERLPDGTFISLSSMPWLVWREHIHQWSHTGYGKRRKLRSGELVEVLTPEPIVAILGAGYRPDVHLSIES